MEHYDDLETRTPEAREAALMAALPGAVSQAKDRTAGFAEILAAKGISHLKDMWGHDVSHEWTWWKRQARHHLQSYLPPSSSG